MLDTSLIIPWRRIDLSTTRGIWCLVDADDYAWLSTTLWNWGWHNKTPWKFYAKRNIGKARSTVYMAREIMIHADPHTAEYQSTHVVDHINGQSLDNRKANLRWSTMTANSKHRMRREDIPSLDAIVAELARMAGADLASQAVPY